MFKRNLGRFRHKITLLKPNSQVRDELGGLLPTVYNDEISLLAMCEQRSQSRQQQVGTYVTADTRYFVVRDLSSVCPNLNTSWRLRYNGFVYNINEITLIEESSPFFMQITATAINLNGGVI